MNRKMQVAALLGATMLSTSVWAQEVDEVIVYSSPFKKAATDVISTTEILDADVIGAQVNGPIGDILAKLPGVSNAGFGPAVGQPVIRGLGGYRIDVMQNGMTVGDIAASGSDHANAVSLFDANRVEVLKGPAALRYGAFAATGVVNSFNRHLDGDAEDGSDILVEYGDNAEETITAFHARRGGFAVSAYSQDADDITIPTHAESDHMIAEEREHAIELGEPVEPHPAHAEGDGENTATENQGYTVSGQFGDDQTNIALMLSSTDMEYGVPGGHAHGGASNEVVTIDMEQQTVQAILNHTPSSGIFNNLRADISISQLEQDELENGNVHTTFEQDSLHLRGEATATILDWKSLLGLEFRDIELEMPEVHSGDDDDDGEDAHFYLPNTERTQYGLFAFAERENNGWLTELALRFDNAELSSLHTEDASENATKSFDIVNSSAGLARKLDGDLLVGGSVSSTERAPSQVELFAEGEHVAAGRSEYGDVTLDTETSLSTELYARKAWGKSQLRVSIFNNDYSDFIYLQHEDDGIDVDGDGSIAADSGDCTGENCFSYKQQDAELSGYEFDYQTMLTLGGRMWDASVSYSALTGELDDGDNLPSIPADKIGLGLGTSFNSVAVQLDVEHVSDQTDVPAGEEGEDHTPQHETDGFTNVDISASYQPPQYQGLTLSAAIRNVTDEEIRRHASPLKDKMPEAGRDIRLTARYKF
jgi:iron complex outermembrane receptor protein